MEGQHLTDSPKRRRFSTRGFTSLLLTLSLLLMGLSGIMLYVSPRGRVANWTDWTLLGFGKEQWGSLHMNASVLFLLVAVLHLTVNWSLFFSYLKKRAVAGLHMKRELVLAVGVVVVCVIGTTYAFPPFSSLMELNHDVKDYWERRTARAPVPHAEELTLVEFAQQIDLSVDTLTETLEKEGFNVAGTTTTVGNLGRQKGVAPSAVLAAIRKHHPDAGATTGGGPGRGAGRGRAWQSGGCSSENPQDEAACSIGSGSCEDQQGAECSSCETETAGGDSGHSPSTGSG